MKTKETHNKLSGVLGAIIGDIAGSRFEFNNIFTKDFELLEDDEVWFTDDTIQTLAIKDAILNNKDIDITMREICMPYIHEPRRSFGNMFIHYVETGHSNESFGNGSAMRVAYLAEYCNELEDVLNKAKETAIISHTHEDAIKGAQCVAGCSFLAKEGKTKDEIFKFANRFYDINLYKLHPTTNFYVSCFESVPYAIKAVMEGKDFVDVIKTAICLGGDSDTVAAMAGSIAGNLFTIDKKLEYKVIELLDKKLLDIYLSQ